MKNVSDIPTCRPIQNINNVKNNNSTLANMIASVKNSIKTFFVGSEMRKRENIHKICAEFITRISTTKIYNEAEILDENKLNSSAKISARVTHKILSKNINKLFNLIKKEMLNQNDKSLSPIDGHADQSVNIMLAALYRAYEKTEPSMSNNIGSTNNAVLKSQIEEIITENFTIKKMSVSNQQNDFEKIDKENVMPLLKKISQKYEKELEELTQNATNKIDYILEKNRILIENLKKYNMD